MAKLRPDLFTEVATSHGLEEAERCWQDVLHGRSSNEDIERKIRRSNIDIPPERWQDFENGWRPEGWD